MNKNCFLNGEACETLRMVNSLCTATLTCQIYLGRSRNWVDYTPMQSCEYTEKATSHLFFILKDKGEGFA